VLLTSFGIPVAFGAPFMALVLVSFLLTSTDTAVRLGRYMMEEIVGAPTTSIQTVASDRFGNAFMQGIIAYVLIGSGSWATLWQLFGGANQLLAALALLTATVWLANWDDTKQLISTGVPMAIMVVITVSGLLWLALHSNLYSKFLNPEWMATAGTVPMLSAAVQILLALVLVYLGLSLVRMGYSNIQTVKRSGGGGVSPGDD
jgi:carbon starvation protein